MGTLIDHLFVHALNQELGSLFCLLFLKAMPLASWLGLPPFLTRGFATLGLPGKFLGPGTSRWRFTYLLRAFSWPPSLAKGLSLPFFLLCHPWRA